MRSLGLFCCAIEKTGGITASERSVEKNRAWGERLVLDRILSWCAWWTSHTNYFK